MTLDLKDLLTDEERVNTRLELETLPNKMVPWPDIVLWRVLDILVRQCLCKSFSEAKELLVNKSTILRTLFDFSNTIEGEYIWHEANIGNFKPFVDFYDCNIDEDLLPGGATYEFMECHNGTPVLLPRIVYKAILRNIMHLRGDSMVEAALFYDYPPYRLDNQFIFFDTAEGEEAWLSAFDNGDLKPVMTKLKRAMNKESKENNNKQESEIMKINYKEKRTVSSQQEDAVYETKKASLELQSEILDIKDDVRQVEELLADLKTNYPLPLDNIVNETRRLRKLNDRLDILTSLMKELGFSANA